MIKLYAIPKSKIVHIPVICNEGYTEDGDYIGKIYLTNENYIRLIDNLRNRGSRRFSLHDDEGKIIFDQCIMYNYNQVPNRCWMQYLVIGKIP